MPSPKNPPAKPKASAAPKAPPSSVTAPPRLEAKPASPPAKPMAKPVPKPVPRQPRATHDPFFKRLLSDPEKAQAFFRCFLPPRIVARLAPDRLPVRLDPQHVDGGLRTTQSDLIYRAFLKDDGFADVDLEHKSQPQNEVHVQLFHHRESIIARNLRELAGQLKDDPVVIPVLAYHGAADWNPQVTLRGETAKEAEAKWQALDLDDFRTFRMVFTDFKRYALGELTDDPELQAALYAMTWEGPDAFLKVLPQLRGPGQPQKDLLTYINQNWHNTNLKPLGDQWKILYPHEGDNPMSTMYERAVHEGFEQGIAHGREQGRETGKAEVLLKQLRLKFARLSAEDRARVTAASTKQLDAWAEAVLTADSLAEIFAR